MPRGVNQGTSTRVIRGMSEFATLASPYSMPVASHGDVELSDSSTNARSRTLNQFLAGVELKAFKMAQAALRHWLQQQNFHGTSARSFPAVDVPI